MIAGQAAPRQRKEELLGKIVYVFIFDSHMSFFLKCQTEFRKGVSVRVSV